MDNSDAQDVIDKVKDNINKQENDTEPEPSMSKNEIPDDTNIPNDTNDNSMDTTQQESKEVNIDELISEIMNRKPISKKISNNTPFKGPKFK